MNNKMSFPTGQETEERIISLQQPDSEETNKRSKFVRLFTDTDQIKNSDSIYNEIYEFLRDQNMTSSGACTLFPKSEIQRYQKLGAIGVLMKGPSDKLIGTIFSIPFPVKCSFSSEPITHGCTTFLNVHQKLRGHGLCKSLIKELSIYGYENNHLCSYFLNNFKLTSNSIPLSTWYHPLDLPKSVGLGFGFPDWNAPSHFHENRIKFACKLPKGWKCKRVVSKKTKLTLELYQSFVSEKRFAWWPTLAEFFKWVQEFPTFTCWQEGRCYGVFSIATVFARMATGLDGELALPVLFATNSKISQDMDYEGIKSSVFKCLLWASKERNLDTLYCHEVGDLTEALLKTNNCIVNPSKNYFSLYNNSMKLTEKDIYVPIF